MSITIELIGVIIIAIMVIWVAVTTIFIIVSELQNKLKESERKLNIALVSMHRTCNEYRSMIGRDLINALIEIEGMGKG